MAKRMKLPNPLLGLVRPGGERYIKSDIEKRRETRERTERRTPTLASTKTTTKKISERT